MFLCDLIEEFFVESVEVILPHVNDINYECGFVQTYLDILDNSYYRDYSYVNYYDETYNNFNQHRDEEKYKLLRKILTNAGCKPSKI